MNGMVQTEKGYAVKNFNEPDKAPIEVGKLQFSDYETAVNHLAGTLYPESYKPYLMAVKDMEPTNDTWNNLIFIGHACGYYDNEQKRFRNAREMNMNAASEEEIAYVDALSSTYESIKSMIR